MRPDLSIVAPFMLAYAFAVLVFSFAAMKSSGFFNFIFKIDRYSPFTVLTAMTALFLMPQYAYFGVIGVLLACLPTLVVFISGASSRNVRLAKTQSEAEASS